MVNFLKRQIFITMEREILIGLVKIFSLERGWIKKGKSITKLGM